MSGIHTVAYMTLIHGMYPSNIIQLKYKHVPKEIRNDNPWLSAPVFGG